MPGDAQALLYLETGEGDRACVSPFGGQVLSWQPAGAEEQLYLSPSAYRDGRRAIRGGVPVIFPRFELRPPHDALPRHGFARTSTFALRAHSQQAQSAELVLALESAPAGVAFPYPFELALRVAVAPGVLRMGLEVHNRGDVDLPCGAALHTYLAVSALSQVSLRGLGGCDHWDAVAGAWRIQRDEPLAIAGELDRIYRASPTLRLDDGARRLDIASTGFDDTVVWNPGPAKAAELADLPPDDYARFVCVEAAQALRPWVVGPGASHYAEQTLRLA